MSARFLQRHVTRHGQSLHLSGDMSKLSTLLYLRNTESAILIDLVLAHRTPDNLLSNGKKYPSLYLHVAISNYIATKKNERKGATRSYLYL